MSMITIDKLWLDKMDREELKCELEDAIEYIQLLEKQLKIKGD